MKPMEVSVSVVMPAYNAAHLLGRSLQKALEAAGDAELLVVDPGSTDDTAAVAESLGARVLRLPQREGPAEARNAGVDATRGSVILFLDADCVAHPDVVSRVRAAFVADPALVSLTGSYDDAPEHPGFFSQYMNLRHHHTHQIARRTNASFWAGCGAVRRDAFQAVGGFDAKRFPRPMIEDIELGLRLKSRGATALDPDLMVCHLKAWSLTSVVVTDIRHRAWPWSRLILEHGGLPNDLNLRTSQRLAALFSPFTLLAIPGVISLAFAAPRWVFVPLVVIAVSLGLNWDFTKFLARKRGMLFASLAFTFHQVHLLYSAMTFVAAKLSWQFSRRKTS